MTTKDLEAGKLVAFVDGVLVKSNKVAQVNETIINMEADI